MSIEMGDITQYNWTRYKETVQEKISRLFQGYFSLIKYAESVHICLERTSNDPLNAI